MYVIVGIGVAILATIVIVLVIVFTHKKSGSDATVPIPITVTVTDPMGTLSGTMQMTKAQINTMNVGNFVINALQTVKLPWSVVDIYWNSIVIYNKSINIQNGIIPDVEQAKNLLTFIGGTIPTNLSIKLNFQRVCHPADKNSLTCDPCKGAAPFCGPTGWVCRDGILPPTEVQRIACCKVGDNGPYGTWDAKTNSVICDHCESAPTIDCGDTTGCAGFGQVCTGTGWTCVPNMSCPDKSKWPNCATCATNQYVVCSSGKFTCENCNPDHIPDCPQSCNLQGLKCNPDNTMSCVPGIEKCPADLTSFESCCTDPLNPIPVCTEGKGITCKNCDGVPKPVNDPDYSKCENGSCLGHAWVCTPSGWKCLPHIAPPPPSFNMSQCCPVSGPNVAFWDPTSKCVACKCPPGTVGCNGSFCGDVGQQLSPCQKICCQAGEQCFSSGLGGCVCCEEQDRVCYSSATSAPICCDPGTICKDGTCRAVCGIDDLGNKRACGTGQKCLEISNLTPAQVADLKQKEGSNAIFSNNDTTAYVCIDDTGCTSGNEVAIPAAIDNYYPCTFMPDSKDPTQPGVGYCTDKDLCSKYPPTNCLDNHYTDGVVTNTLTPGFYAIKVMSEGKDAGYLAVGHDGIISCPTHQTISQATWTLFVNPTPTCLLYSDGSRLAIQISGVTTVPDHNSPVWIGTSSPSPYGETASLVVGNYSNAALFNFSSPYLAASLPNEGLGHSIFFLDTIPARTNTAFVKYTPPITGTNVPSIGIQLLKIPLCDMMQGVCENVPLCSYDNVMNCNSDSNCTWRQVVQYMAGDDLPIGQSINIQTRADQIQKELQKKFNMQDGNYCNPGDGTPYTRVTAIQLDKSKCGWLDCWTRSAQSNVIDVNYNENTGVCAVLQSCDAGGVTPITNLDCKTNCSWPSNINESIFPACTVGTTPASCPVTSASCVGSCSTNCVTPQGQQLEGQIIPPLKYSCGPEFQCVRNPDGEFSDLTACNNSCCPAGTTRHADKCYVDYPPQMISGSFCRRDSITDKMEKGGGCTSANPHATYNYCCGDDQGTSCQETLQNIPFNSYYCKAGAYTDPGLYCPYSTSGSWVQCTNPSGCSDNNSWRNSDTTTSYCTWPPS